MKLKAYKTSFGKRALRATLVSDYLDAHALEGYRTKLDCSNISDDMYISFFTSSLHPVINIDEYFAYIELMGIDLTIVNEARQESFVILIEILKTKYGIEYVDPEC